MLFNSLEFLILLTAAFFLYYLPPLRAWQVPMLLASSLVFYGWNHPSLTLLLLLSIAINAVSSHRVCFGPSGARLFWAALGAGVNLAILIFFKYSGMLYRTFSDAEPASGSIGSFLIHLPLPIGISFFTFQGISLIIDTYRGSRGGDAAFRLEPSFRRHLLIISFFKAFFPQLISGPIVKAKEFLPQIRDKSFRDIDWNLCGRKLILGFFLKSVIADQLKDQTFWITPSYFQNCSSLTLVALLFGYSIQIFSDFAGYSLIAIGIAGLFGYELPENFNWPYLSRSFSEFWTRWHISLSSWLRQYLYIPLGGNRKGGFRTYLNLFIVMFLGGLWHGAAWSYAIWGTWHGLLLAIERLLGKNEVQDGAHPVAVLLRIMLVFTLVTLGWLLFRLPEFSEALLFLRCLLTNGGKAHSMMILYAVTVFSLPVVLLHLAALYRDRRGRAFPAWLDTLAYAMMLFFIFTNSGEPGEFIYFQF
jgi:alginate O-acetyltransferase complex protein AlgI